MLTFFKEPLIIKDRKEGFKMQKTVKNTLCVVCLIVSIIGIWKMNLFSKIPLQNVSASEINIENTLYLKNQNGELTKLWNPQTGDQIMKFVLICGAGVVVVVGSVVVLIVMKKKEKGKKSKNK